MEYAKSVAVKTNSKDAPVTANFAPPPSDGKKSRNPDKVRPNKQTEPAKHDENK